MTTSLILLVLLTGPWVLAKLWNSAVAGKQISTRAAGLSGLTLLFCFTGVGHFILTEPMAKMIPASIPYRVETVYATGVLEILLAFAVLFPSWRRQIGWLLLGLMITFLPVNIYAAVNHIGPGGHQWGPIYLLIRVPLQIFLIVWIWQFAVKPGKTAPKPDSEPTTDPKA